VTLKARLLSKILKLGEGRPLLTQGLFQYFCYFNRGLVPPQLFNYVGGKEFLKIGEGYFDYIMQFCSVQPEEKILDVGCGIGRVAIHFIDYMNEKGQYEGFDVVKKGINWCNVKIAKKHPNFSFKHVNVYNKEYNQKGSIKAKDFIFPYEDSFFDFAFATSVFTHMLPDAVPHYLNEMHRVLKTNGRCLISCFILNEESKTNMPNSRFNFKQVEDRYGVMIENNPESAIAYEEDFFEKLFSNAGLKISHPINYGTWSGRRAEVGGQDIIVAKKNVLSNE